MAMQWIPDEGKRKKVDYNGLATNIAVRFAGDESQLE